ncbi:unnamed protein product [Tetraodon nigroviridis]|uniref:Olfactory receptor n=1 Tax=Tetraodon nigroviridis TaxID=99883 RepID=Q4SB26_TETNG|nr:odorant receptor [Tetraodon nigroviridis]CAG02156.1 unnamed protein product [Tetraodon nigroviridis]
MNSSQVSYFLLGAYENLGAYSYLLFTLVLLFYLLIVASNLLLTAVICLNRSLHQPMYVLLCSLFVNQLYGSTALFPFLLLQILSDLHAVSASFCFLQIFCVHSYGGVEFMTLAAMAYDRYAAICQPLQYQRLMSSSRLALLLAAAWWYPSVFAVVLLWLRSPLQLCGNTIHKVYCGSHAVVKLSCSGSTAVNAYRLVATFSVVVGCLLVIGYSYLRILQVCSSGSRRTRQKAVSTCSPHLASLLNFSIGVAFETVQSRLDMQHLPNLLRVVLSLYFLTCPPLLNPVIYGLKMSKLQRLVSKAGR